MVASLETLLFGGKPVPNTQTHTLTSYEEESCPCMCIVGKEPCSKKSLTDLLVPSQRKPLKKRLAQSGTTQLNRAARFEELWAIVGYWSALDVTRGVSQAGRPSRTAEKGVEAGGSRELVRISAKVARVQGRADGACCGENGQRSLS
jgi:hypothetical protein